MMMIIMMTMMSKLVSHDEYDEGDDHDHNECDDDDHGECVIK